MKVWLSVLTILWLPAIGSSQTFSTQILNGEAFASSVCAIQDYDGDQDLDIVSNRSNPRAIYWLENLGDSSIFQSHPIITSGLDNEIRDLDTADLDKDGDIDYVICFHDNTAGFGELAWFEKLNDGSYQKHVIDPSRDFTEAALGDLDGNGFKDIISEGSAFFADSFQNFTEAVICDDGCFGALDIADIDNDGDLDVALGGGGLKFDSSGARILINDGMGNFSFLAWLNSYTANHNYVAKEIKIVDLNGDSVKDVIGFRTIVNGGLFFFDGNDDFSRIRIEDTNIVDVGGAFEIFDVDTNGALDIVRQYTEEDKVDVLYQTSPMVFNRVSLEQNWENDGAVFIGNMATGDMDGDGDLDVVFPEEGNLDHDISWFENDSGQLFKHLIFGQLKEVRIPKISDIDGDGKEDIFAVVPGGAGDPEDEFIQYKNINGSQFVQWRIHDAIDGASDLEFVDLDGDLDTDIITSAYNTNTVFWLRNDSLYADWKEDTLSTSLQGPLGITSGDLTMDGKADVVVAAEIDNKVVVLIQVQTDSFTLVVVDSIFLEPREVEIRDLNKDGFIDIIAVSSNASNSLAVYYGDGSGNFTKQLVFSGSKAVDLEVGDWNNDGWEDVIVGFDEVDFGVVVFYNDSASYTPDTLETPGYIGSIKVANLDNDLDLDLVTGHQIGSFDPNLIILQAFLQDSSQIVDTILLTTRDEGKIFGIDIGDINNDNRVDVIYADQSSDDLVLVTISEICPNKRYITGDMIDGSYGAGQIIRSDGMVNGGADVTFQAGMHIDLLPNFEVALGSIIEILLGSCKN